MKFLCATFLCAIFLEPKITRISFKIYSLNVILMYVTMKTYLSVVIISYGLLAGIGIGIAYGVTLGTPIKWFPEREGLIIGIINSGYGISAVIFIVIQNAILQINPKNKFDNFPLSFLIIGIIYAVLQFCGAILMTKKPDDKLDGTEINSISYKSESESVVFNNNKLEAEPHQIVFVVDFWILWIIFCLNSICISIITTLYHRYPLVFEDYGKKHDNLMSILFVIFNFMGRIFWGYLMDKISFKSAVLTINLISAIFMGTLPTMSFMMTPTVNYIYLLWVVVIIFFLSGNFPLFPYMCFKLFGIKNFITNYGMLYTACSVGGTTFSLILNMVFANSDVNKILYRNIFIIGSVLLLIAASLTTFYRGKPRILYRY